MSNYTGEQILKRLKELEEGNTLVGIKTIDLFGNVKITKGELYTVIENSQGDLFVLDDRDIAIFIRENRNFTKAIAYLIQGGFLDFENPHEDPVIDESTPPYLEIDKYFRTVDGDYEVTVTTSHEGFSIIQRMESESKQAKLDELNQMRKARLVELEQQKAELEKLIYELKGMVE